MWRVGVVALAALSGFAVQDSAPILSLWYRGDPAGEARARDLEDIRALGFSAVTWPRGGGPQTAALIRLADAAGLKVVLPDAANPDPAAAAAGRANIAVDRDGDDALWPLVWRAVAHGAHIISIDPGARLEPAALLARPPGWMAAASLAVRQLRANGALFAQCRPGPAVVVEAPPPGVEVLLLDAGRSWVAVATNVSPARVRVVARMPASVPYAMWVSLIDGSTTAMLDEPAGPRWSFDLDAWGVRLLVIDKRLK